MDRRTNISTRVLVVVSTIVVLIFLLASSVQAGPDVAATDTHRVVAGDTLWDIAAERTGDDESVWTTVRTIQRINELDGSLIRPGQVLLVPTG